jgi:hypothetical protein
MLTFAYLLDAALKTHLKYITGEYITGEKASAGRPTARGVGGAPGGGGGGGVRGGGGGGGQEAELGDEVRAYLMKQVIYMYGLKLLVHMALSY